MTRILIVWFFTTFLLYVGFHLASWPVVKSVAHALMWATFAALLLSMFVVLF